MKINIFALQQMFTKERILQFPRLNKVIAIYDKLVGFEKRHQCRTYDKADICRWYIANVGMYEKYSMTYVLDKNDK